MILVLIRFFGNSFHDALDTRLNPPKAAEWQLSGGEATPGGLWPKSLAKCCLKTPMTVFSIVTPVTYTEVK